MAEKDYDHFFKILIVGGGDEGKTSLFKRFTEDFYTYRTNATIGVDFAVLTVDVNGERVKLQIWDTAGHERFRSLISAYYKNTHGVIIVYDVTSRDSFEDVDWFLNSISKYCADACKILVGNKCDLESRRQVTTEEAVKFGESVGIKVFETSAHKNINVEEMFYEIIDMCLMAKLKRVNCGAQA